MKIPITKPIWRLGDLLETPNEALLTQLDELRLRRSIKRIKIGKRGKERKPKPEVLFKLESTCMKVEGFNENLAQEVVN